MPRKTTEINQDVAKACGFKPPFVVTEDGMIFQQEPLAAVPDYASSMTWAMNAASQFGPHFRLEWKNDSQEHPRRPKTYWHCDIWVNGFVSCASASKPEVAVCLAVIDAWQKKREPRR